MSINRNEKQGRPFRLSTWVAIIGWINVLVLAWLMIGRVVSTEGMNQQIFWAFLVVAVCASLGSASPPKPVVPTVTPSDPAPHVKGKAEA